MDSWKLSLVLLIGSLAVSALFWITGHPIFFLFLFVPLAPLFFGRHTTKRCPVCGWKTTGNERFCPFDAAPLEDSGSTGGRKHT